MMRQMKSMMKQMKPFFILGAGLLGCQQSFDSPSDLHNDEVPASYTDTAVLGQAYSKNRKKIFNVNCVKGESIVRGNEIGILKYQKDMRYHEVMDALNGNLSLGVQFSQIHAGASAKIALSQASDDHSETHTFFWSGINRKEIFKPGTVVPSERGEFYIENYNDRLSEKCGDEFIAEIQYGAILLATLRIDFLNKSDKKSFGGGLNIGLMDGILDVKGDFEKVNNDIKRRTKVSVIVKQLGGNATGLLTVVPDNVMNCSLSDISPCLTTMSNLIKYGEGAFRESLEMPDDDHTNWNVIKYVTQRYDESGLEELVGSTPPAELHQEVLRMRRSLERGHIKELTIRERASRLRNNGRSHLTNVQIKQVEDIELKADQNARIYVNGLEVCFDQPSKCVDNWNLIKVYLAEYDANLLDIKIPLEKPRTPQIPCIRSYEHVNYKGRVWTFFCENSPSGWNDKISSFKIPSGYSIKVCEHARGDNRFPGQCRYYSGNVSWVGHQFNDKISYIKYLKN